MKHSGVEYLGDVPDHWDIRPAVTLAEVLTSTVDKKEYDGDERVRLCNYTDVYYRDRILDDPELMKATATAEQIARFSVLAGDVPFTKDSETSDDVGVPSYVPADLSGVVYGYHLGIYRPNDKRYGRFLKYLLESRYAKITFKLAAPGVTRVGLSRNTIRYFRVPTPPPDEATAIADYLDRETAQIDAFIAKSEHLITLLAERRAAVAEQAFAQHVGIGRRLKPYLPEVDVRAGAEWTDLPLLSVSIAWGVRRRDEVTDDEPAAEDLSNYKVADRGDLVLNRMRAFQGALGVAPERGMVSPDYAVLRTIDGVDPVWVASVMKTDKFVGEMTQRLKGIGSTESGAVRTPRINVSDLGAILLDVPVKEEQRMSVANVVARTSRISGAIVATERSIALARERRVALISAAVTGQLRVPE